MSILTLGASGGYEPSEPDVEGFITSRIWSASFRLVRNIGRAGWIDYRLERRP